MPVPEHKEKTFAEKIKEFLGIKKTEQKTEDYTLKRDMSTNAAPEQWNIASIPNAGNVLKMEPAGQSRVDFRHGISEDVYEASFQQREKSLYALAEEKYKSLIQLFVDTKTDYEDGSYQNIRKIMSVLAEEYPRLLYIAGIENPDEEQLKEKQSRLNHCRNLLDHVYTMGESYLKANARKLRNRDFVAQQRNLISRIMNAANDAQLAMERMILIQQERDFMEEDRTGETMKQAVDDHELEKLSEEVIKELHFYTENEAIAKNMAGYQWLNGVLRGKYRLKDVPRDIRGHIKTALEKINGALNTNQGKSKKLFRGTDLTPAFGDQVQHPESLVGRTFSDKGYLSTSRDREQSVTFITGRLQAIAAGKFVESRIQHSGKGFTAEAPILTGDSMLEITSRKGAHSLDISARSRFQNEAEVLFAPGTPIYIHSMRMEVEEVRLPRDVIKYYIQDNKLDVDIDEICPPEWNNVYVKFGIPVYQVEIRG